MSSTLHRGKSIDDPIYLEVAGERWRVHDVKFENRRYHRTKLPSSFATHRIFVSAAGVRRSHQFTRGEDRQVSVTALEAQLRRAKYLAKDPPLAKNDLGVIGGPVPGAGS